MPKSPKYPLTEPLRHFLDLTRQPILPNLPPELLSRVLPLLKHTPTDPCTGLALRFTQPTNRALLYANFTHRPWDWGENIDDGPPGEGVRNSASIPLEIFGVEATGDRIQQWDAEGPNRLWNSTEKDEWHTRTVVGSEVTFQREWVDSRVLDIPEEYESSEEGEGGREGSSGRRKSVSGGSGVGGGREKKRKASASPVRSEGSDDDIQIIEGPVQGGAGRGR